MLLRPLGACYSCGLVLLNITGGNLVASLLDLAGYAADKPASPELVTPVSRLITRR